MYCGRYWVCPIKKCANVSSTASAHCVEVNALKGKLGPLETVKGVITCGFLLTALFAVIMAVIL